MVLVAALLVVGLVCGIAAWFVIREAARLSVEPPPPVFDADEAYDWVIANLPDEVAATLTPSDARRILDFEVEYFERTGVAVNDAAVPPSGLESIVGGSEMVEYIRMRARDTGEVYFPEQVQGVLDTQVEYLRAIGAVGPATNDDETGSEAP